MAEGGGALRELLAHFEIEVDDKQLEAFEEGIGGVVEKIKHAGAIITGFLAAGEIKEFFESTIEQAAHVQDLATKLGVGTEELQKFQGAARLMGVDAESAAHSVMLLQRHIGEAVKAGGTGKLLGVDLKTKNGEVRETMDVLGDLADAFKDMKSQPEKAEAAMKLFGRQGMALVPILQGGREELEKVFKELEETGGIMSGDFLKQAKAADDEMIKMKMAFQGLKVRVVNQFLPGIRSLVERLMGLVLWFQKTTDATNALQHAFDFLKLLGVAKAVMMVYEGFKKMAEAEAIADALDPFTLMLIGLFALYVLFDDFMTMMEGGDSVLGDLLGPDKEAFVETMSEAVEELKQAWEDMKEPLRDVGEALLYIFKAAIPLMPYLLKGFTAVVMVVAQLVDLLKIATSMISDVFKGEDQGGVESGWQSLQTHTGHLMDLFTGKKMGATMGQREPEDMTFGHPGTREPEGFQFGPPPTVATGVGAGAVVNSPTKVEMKNNINVTVNHESSDTSDEVGRAVGEGARKELDATLINAMNAVKTM